MGGRSVHDAAASVAGVMSAWIGVAAAACMAVALAGAAFAVHRAMGGGR